MATLNDYFDASCNTAAQQDDYFQGIQRCLINNSGQDAAGNFICMTR